MAQRVSVVLVSDISGEELPEGKGETVTFALDGKSYELDLSNKEADAFRGSFQDYIAAARKVSGGRGTARKSSGGSGRDLGAIREWARSQGMEVSERGKVKQSVIDAYDAAN